MKIIVRKPGNNNVIFGDEIEEIELPFQLTTKQIEDALKAKKKFIDIRKHRKIRYTYRRIMELKMKNARIMGHHKILKALLEEIESKHKNKEISRATYYRIKKYYNDITQTKTSFIIKTR